jgi:hypothetical protein
LSDRACLTGILSTGPPVAVKLTDRELWSIVVQCARFLVAQTGRNPTGRAKLGSKCHLICDGRGVTFAIQLARANRNDSQQAPSLVDVVPTLQGDRGCARRRPYCVLGDRRYDAEAIRQGLRARHGVPFLARTASVTRVESPRRQEWSNLWFANHTSFSLVNRLGWGKRPVNDGLLSPSVGVASENRTLCLSYLPVAGLLINLRPRDGDLGS